MSWVEHFDDWLRNYITPVFAFLNLLGIYLVVLGIGLGALSSSLRNRKRTNNSVQESPHLPKKDLI
jgi:hypothetical protein